MPANLCPTHPWVCAIWEVLLAIPVGMRLSLCRTSVPIPAWFLVELEIQATRD